MGQMKCLLPMNCWANFGPPLKRGTADFLITNGVGRTRFILFWQLPKRKNEICISKFAYANFATQDRCILIQHVLIELICIAHVVIEHVFIDDVLRLLLESVLSSTYT